MSRCTLLLLVACHSEEPAALCVYDFPLLVPHCVSFADSNVAMGVLSPRSLVILEGKHLTLFLSFSQSEVPCYTWLLNCVTSAHGVCPFPKSVCVSEVLAAVPLSLCHGEWQGPHPALASV